ncbi:BMP-binding endothelial regulator protein-like [Lingula anatina]|uniref:BMP-binding endothelial regulator protein-like n=1 Tax=Lingula anatina TaxID=7574 RepID=A0A1S3JDB3_LINAN|nr:BMP-binding endothelial regulator protein-like [Lingula anatina]|eukprot:XP_013408397.1 BMP-binding endothelial regulator protein-like [Lingula anatina]
MYRNGQSFSLKSDPCTQCTCKKGNVQCSKRACPVLNCPPEVIYTPKGTCCPRCNGSRTFFDLGKTRCLFRYKVYKEGQYMPLDKCTGCTCKTGTMVCESETCPPLTCAEDEIIRDEGSCCARCKPKKKCEYNGVLHEHRATWKPDLCTTCTCDNGSSKCELEQCSNRLECPPNHRLQMVYGQCCPKCVEEDAVCAVFGDPHYRTFDGRIFNFQGTCRYVLAQDCANNSFSVRVQNHARSTHSFAWTNRVSIHLGKTKIVLQQNLVIKVDNKKVDIPHVKLGAFSVMKSGYSVIVRTNVGLKVIWDGDSYVEVAVPAKYKSKMCGLCGNYNGIEADDFKGKKGGLYLNADKFGNSWRIGSRKSCYKSHAKKRSRGKKNRYDASCNNDFTKKTRAAEECSILKGQVFSQCRSKVPLKHYYRSCITDMCECPSSRQNCVCESLKAYARECERKGVKIDYSQTTCKGSR